MNPDDLGPLPGDDPLGEGDMESSLDPTADHAGPSLDSLEAEAAALSAESGHVGDGGSAVPDADIESLFGAGGALELPPDRVGDQELARWLDAPLPPGPLEGLPEFAEGLARRLRGD